MTHLTCFPCPLVRSGSRRGAAHHKRNATQRAVKESRPSVARGDPPDALRPLPDVSASRCGPRLPGGPLRAIKWAIISGPWY